MSRLARSAAGVESTRQSNSARARRWRLGLHINHQSIFARKNYFYPDLPKGYQISQYDQPFSANGELEIMTAERDEAGHPMEWRPKKIRITRLHLEEDAGKNVHEGLPDVDRYSYIDLNRAGVPLAEIVTEPDFRSSWEAYDYVNHVRRVAAMGRRVRSRHGEGKSALRGKRFGAACW